MFEIHMGIPEMEAFWRNLTEKVHSGKASKNDIKLYRKLGKTLLQIATDPRYPGLETHDIEALSNRYGMKVWQSYLENHTPGAGRVFWVYGPDQGDITVIGLEPHPNDKANAYKKITLSALGKTEEV
jgi:hypothetical protein